MRIQDGRAAPRRRALAAAGACVALCAFVAGLVASGASAQMRSAATASAQASGGGILFPKPSSGPPRQFPLPSSSPTPSATRSSPPPPVRTTPASPPPVRTAPSPRPATTPPKPTPTPTPKPTPPPKPTPTLQIVLPPTAYHPVPHKRLSTVFVVFLVAIVPVSLARIRR